MNAGDLALTAGETVANFVAGRLAASGWSAIVTRLRTRQQGESQGGPADARGLAYAAFRRSAIDYRTTLTVLAAAPPRLVGALWSVPLHLRLTHRAPVVASELLDHFLSVATVGQTSTIEAAEEVMSSLSAASDAYASSVGKRRNRRSATLQTALTHADAALADFTVRVREDLGYGRTNS